MKKLRLSRGAYALIDDADYASLSQYKWTLKGDGYAHRSTSRPNRKWILMHRDIMAPAQGFVVDHINGNILDNRRSNLRVCTPGQNRMNTSKQRRNTSGFKGVSLHKPTNTWHTTVGHTSLGYHKTPLLAALEYNKFAPKIFGEYARLNDI